MANTLKFGNGNWATKEDSTLAYSDQYDNFKPLPFDFTRASNATVVNKEGLIETVANGIPRIDFADSEDGALLLEPQRTNLVTYSEDFSSATWTKQNVTINSSSITSPNGTNNASEILETTYNANHGIFYTLTTALGTTDYSVSMFVKKLNRRYFGLQSYYNLTRGAIAFFDLDTGTLVYEFAEGTDYSVSNSKIEDYGNGWYKISTVFQIPTSTDLYAGFVLADTEWTTGTSYDNPYLGDITKGVYIYGVQLEQASYPTSYIPTQGSAATRVAESCSQTTPSGVIGQTEGTLYAEYYFDATIDNSGGSDRDIVGIENNSSNFIKIVHYGNGSSSYSKKVYLYAIVGGSYDVNISTPTQSSGLMKVAFGYKNNDYVLYVNGIQIGTDTSASVPTCSIVKLGKNPIVTTTSINEAKLYNTRLSNSELAELTTI